MSPSSRSCRIESTAAGKAATLASPGQGQCGWDGSARRRGIRWCARPRRRHRLGLKPRLESRSRRGRSGRLAQRSDRGGGGEWKTVQPCQAAAPGTHGAPRPPRPSGDSHPRSRPCATHPHSSSFFLLLSSRDLLQVFISLSKRRPKRLEFASTRASLPRSELSSNPPHTSPAHGGQRVALRVRRFT